MLLGLAFRLWLREFIIHAVLPRTILSNSCKSLDTSGGTAAEEMKLSRTLRLFWYFSEVLTNQTLLWG